MLNIESVKQNYITEEVELDNLIEAIHGQRCVLFLGPELYPSVNLFQDLCNKLNVSNNQNISLVFPEVELFLFPNARDRSRVCLAVEEFYKNYWERFSNFYKKIASLPFHLIVSATPDMGLSRIFEREGITHQFCYYNRNKTAPDPPYDKIAFDPKEQRLIFNLFGRSSMSNSLVLSHDDLFQYLQNILGNKGLSHDDYEKLNFDLSNATHFLFLGLQFKKWYMQLMLRLLNPDQEKGFQYALNPEFTDETLVYYGGQFQIKFVEGHTPEEFLDKLVEASKVYTQPFEEYGSVLNLMLNWHKQGYLVRILEKLEKLAKENSDEDLATKTALVFSRYNQLQEQIKKGVVKSEDAMIERNRISNALYDLIKEKILD